MFLDWVIAYSQSYADFITFLSFLILLFNLRKFKFNKSAIFLVGFGVVVITSFVALVQYMDGVNNILTYYVGGDLIYKVLLLVFYYLILKNKKLMIVIISLYCLYNLLFLFFQFPYGSEGTFKEFNSNIYKNYILSYFVNLLMFFTVWITFFRETFNSDAIFQLRYYFPFWITVSCMLYDVGMLPIFLNSDDAYRLEIMEPIISVSSTISYAALIYGIIVNKPLYNSPMQKLHY